MSLETLQILWYGVICISIVCYVMLDGFDLGVGCLHLLAPKDEHRRIFLNAIGPVWDGNAVWIVVVGGALFAGFPEVYATVFSGFYTEMMILLCGFIFRAVAIEFRSKKESKFWRSSWDILFSIASMVIAFSLGVMLGSLITGLPIDYDKNFNGTFWDLFNPFTILVGLLSVSLFSMHGAIYLTLKTEGELHERVRRWIMPLIVAFVFFYVSTSYGTFQKAPHMLDRFRDFPLLTLVPTCMILILIAIPFLSYKKWEAVAFICSCATIALLFSLFGISTYPYIVRSTFDPDLYSLTVFNSSSSRTTLEVLLLIAIIGVPLVLAYGYYIYKIFYGKVKLDKTSY